MIAGFFKLSLAFGLLALAVYKLAFWVMVAWFVLTRQ